MVSQHQRHPLLSMAVKLPVWLLFMKQAGCAKESTPGGHIFAFFMMMVSQNIHKRGHRKTNRKTPLLQSQVLKRPSHYVSRGGSHEREHQGSGFNLAGEEQRERGPVDKYIYWGWEENTHKSWGEMGLIECAFDCSTWDANTGKWKVQGQSRQYLARSSQRIRSREERRKKRKKKTCKMVALGFLNINRSTSGVDMKVNLW